MPLKPAERSAAGGESPRPQAIRRNDWPENCLPPLGQGGGLGRCTPEGLVVRASEATANMAERPVSGSVGHAWTSWRSASASAHWTTHLGPTGVSDPGFPLSFWSTKEKDPCWGNHEVGLGLPHLALETGSAELQSVRQ